MTRPSILARLTLLTASLLTAAALSPALAETPAPSLTYKVSLGGMNAGIFKGFEIPTHRAIIQGDNIAVTEVQKAISKDTVIKISGGRVSSFMLKKMSAMIGQQMTVEVQVAPIGLNAGQRCVFTLEYAFLKTAEPDGFTFRPSELPDYACK